MFLQSLLISTITFALVKADCAVPSVTTASGTFAPKEICSGDLIFEDNFDSLNFKKWQHELTLSGGGNWEFEWYVNNRTNSFVDDGVLYLKPSLTTEVYSEDFLFSGEIKLTGGAPADYCTNDGDWGCARTGSPSNALNPVRSARIRSLYGFSFKYGRLEISAKLPTGDWLWPAIWLLPLENAYSTWPASGEIDLMESRGNENLLSSQRVNIGTQQVSQTLHWGPDYFHNAYERTHWEANNAEGYNRGFHKYGLEWTPDYLKFYIDDEEIGAVSPPEGGFWELGELANSGYQSPWKYDSKMAPFDQEFYIIMNVAVGGTNGFFPDDGQNPDPKPWTNESPTASTDFWNARESWLRSWNLEGSNDAALQVDYVRVYAL